jgi:excisionase family DNA binding protein
VSGRLLTARQLAEHIGVSPSTVLDWWEARKIPGFKFSRAVRFDLDEVLAVGRRAADGPTNSVKAFDGVTSLP